jgi:hypothetical protein
LFCIAVECLKVFIVFRIFVRCVILFSWDFFVCLTFRIFNTFCCSRKSGNFLSRNSCVAVFVFFIYLLQYYFWTLRVQSVLITVNWSNVTRNYSFLYNPVYSSDAIELFEMFSHFHSYFGHTNMKTKNNFCLTSTCQFSNTLREVIGWTAA